MKTVLAETGAGLESIRFGISDNLDELKKQIELEGEELKYLGNPDLYLHGPFLDLNPMSYDSRIRQVTMDRFNACYEAALELGAKGMVFHSCMIPTVYFTIGWADRMADFWNEFLEDKAGIPVNMENVLDREILPFVDVAKLVEHPDFGLCLDMGHAHCYADDPVTDWIREAGPYLKHIHAHDNDGSGDRHRAIGEGNIPMAEVFSMLEALPQELTWTIENNTIDDYRTSFRWISNR